MLPNNKVQPRKKENIHLALRVTAVTRVGEREDVEPKTHKIIKIHKIKTHKNKTKLKSY